MDWTTAVPAVASGIITPLVIFMARRVAVIAAVPEQLSTYKRETNGRLDKIDRSIERLDQTIKAHG